MADFKMTAKQAQRQQARIDALEKEVKELRKQKPKPEPKEEKPKEEPAEEKPKKKGFLSRLLED